MRRNGKADRLVIRLDKSWPVHDAKARFSELLDVCVNEGPQLVTRRGVEIAVLVTIDEWKRLRNAARPSLKELLMSDMGRADFDPPPRGQAKRRASVTL